IGGTHSGAGNIIAFNGGAGVLISSGTGNAILSNAIFSNGALGIDLAPAGVTPNDLGDSDSGANTLQNFPGLTSATSLGGTRTITGVLISSSLTGFVLQFFSNTACDPSGFGEGRTFIGSTTVFTSPTGLASFTVTFSTPVPAGQFITAIATDLSG